jgi:2-oxoglutarate dehydrogenase E2 component (dihydrolipoamide succinyltransferase)
MQGGTFTISNGGIYGSLLSTPILNAPQSGILGMHRIEERAVVRDADQLLIAGIEKTIGDLGRRARDGQLKIDEMQGGTFTISNGGIYGSLMSSPILNPPQSGILGMHKIQDRPVVVKGQIVVRPMMYLALSYDHRVVDGKGAVTFLVRVKEALEDPRRLLMDL